MALVRFPDLENNSYNRMAQQRVLQNFSISPVMDYFENIGIAKRELVTKKT